MRRAWLWLTVIGIVVVLGCLAFPRFSDRPIPGYRSKALQEAKQVGIALKLYALDHDGRLPESLTPLIPSYVPETGSHLLKHMTLTMPRARLEDLPTNYIIAWKLIPEDGDRIVAVYSDTNSAIIRDKRP